MPWKHPIGEDHPFPEVYRLAQKNGFEQLEIVNLYEGGLIRLYTRTPHVVFKLKGDPGSALDRQRFDYATKITLTPSTADQMLRDIIAHLTELDVGS
ncbi:MAG: hypothetical protein ACRBB0_11150 [Pelagimonas sp.]|uniref:hypothetical protein n=1 Tax=Pelagimonas sp. TaxID=2073170 RepID=UPI003D6B5C71